MTDLPTQSDFDDYAAWAGRDVLGPDGERIGAVDVIFLDEATSVPEWVLVSLDDGAAFVPLAGATVEEASIRVEPARDRVESAPKVDADETLSVADEKRLYEHYGLDYSREESSSVLPEGATVDAEERPRLRKYVGAPVAAPAGDEAETAADETATKEAPAADETPTTEAPAADKAAATAGAADTVAATAGAGGTSESAADRMAPRNLSPATDSTLPPPAPMVQPPDGGFQAPQAQDDSRSKAKMAIPLALAGAIAGLIAVLAYRRRS